MAALLTASARETHRPAIGLQEGTRIISATHRTGSPQVWVSIRSYEPDCINA